MQTETDLRAFADLVFEMREAQKAYWDVRTSRRLNMAKALENQVDQAVTDIRLGALPRQELQALIKPGPEGIR